jgi:hypothetical protein
MWNFRPFWLMSLVFTSVLRQQEECSTTGHNAELVETYFCKICGWVKKFTFFILVGCILLRYIYMLRKHTTQKVVFADHVRFFVWYVYFEYKFTFVNMMMLCRCCDFACRCPAWTTVCCSPTDRVRPISSVPVQASWYLDSHLTCLVQWFPFTRINTGNWSGWLDCVPSSAGASRCYLYEPCSVNVAVTTLSSCSSLEVIPCVSATGLEHSVSVPWTSGQGFLHCYSVSTHTKKC